MKLARFKTRFGKTFLVSVGKPALAPNHTEVQILTGPDAGSRFWAPDDMLEQPHPLELLALEGKSACEPHRSIRQEPA